MARITSAIHQTQTMRLAFMDLSVMIILPLKTI